MAPGKGCGPPEVAGSASAARICMLVTATASAAWFAQLAELIMSRVAATASAAWSAQLFGFDALTSKIGIGAAGAGALTRSADSCGAGATGSGGLLSRRCLLDFFPILRVRAAQLYVKVYAKRRLGGPCKDFYACLSVRCLGSFAC